MGMRNGFTLIEFSIVLVVIAFILGGILAGSSLIEAAEVRHAVADINNLKLAVGTFKTKYNCLPGDCANAKAFFPEASNGNGNGIYANHTEWKYEGDRLVWQHLQAAGYNFYGPYTISTAGIAGPDPGVDSPAIPWMKAHGVMKNALYQGSNRTYIPALYLNQGFFCAYPILNGCEGFQASIQRNYMSTNHIVLGATADLSPTDHRYVADGILKAEFLQAMDQKMDDGKPLTGQMRVYHPMSPGSVSRCTLLDSTDLSQPYRKSGTNRFCGAYIQLGY